MSELCIVGPDDVADTISPAWNDLERYDADATKLLHFTIVPIQPWKNDDNPLRELWMAGVPRGGGGGRRPPEEVEFMIDRGLAKQSLRGSLRLAPSRRSTVANASLEIAEARHRITQLERKIDSMEHSLSWRLGSGIVRAVRTPAKLLRRRGGLTMTSPMTEAERDEAAVPEAGGGPKQRPWLVINPGSTPLRQYLRDVLHHRDLIRVLAGREIKLRYRQTVLGVSWVLLGPLLSAGILGFVFGKVAELSTDGMPFFLFSYASVAAYGLFSTATTTGHERLHLQRRPRLEDLLPARDPAAVEHALGAARLRRVARRCCSCCCSPPRPRAGRASSPAGSSCCCRCGSCCSSCFAQGLGALLGSFAVRYRDIPQVIPVLIQLALYASPVAYAVKGNVPEEYLNWYYLNPLVSLFEAFRWSDVQRRRAVHPARLPDLLDRHRPRRLRRRVHDARADGGQVRRCHLSRGRSGSTTSSKTYQINTIVNRPTLFTEAIMHRLRHPLSRAKKEMFDALDSVSIDVKQAETVGIIGRNGAGKSTLLKILSRIVEPTRGRVELCGRVGSLLEVGTGFHPELTGRENVYLNGAILGMKRATIDREFDAIVEFAEVEQFLDTPVKRYCSGMYVRLAFAVAAHLESRDPDRRRGAGRRRRRVPAEVPRQDGRGLVAGGPHRPVRQPQHGGGRVVLPARASTSSRAASPSTATPAPPSTTTSGAGDRRGPRLRGVRPLGRGPGHRDPGRGPAAPRDPAPRRDARRHHPHG